MIWLNPTDPAVRSAIVSGAYGRTPHSSHAYPEPTDDAVDTITVALQVASDWLTRLTGWTIHPAGSAQEDFRVVPQAHRLSPTFSPLRRLVSVHKVDKDCIDRADEDPWCRHGDSIYFEISQWSVYGPFIFFDPMYQYSFDYWYYNYFRTRLQRHEQLRIEYEFGSTVTASARRAVIALAHQLFLETSACPDCEECQLPGRTTNVTREGLSYNLVDPALLTHNMIGLPIIDQWVQSVNPKGGTRAPGVWTPDAPPPVVRAVRGAYPQFVVATSGDVASGAVVTTTATTSAAH